MDYIKIFNTHRIDDMTKERIETPLFDEDSVREAIINAFVHNDWKNETPLQYLCLTLDLRYFHMESYHMGLLKI